MCRPLSTAILCSLRGALSYTPPALFLARARMLVAPAGWAHFAQFTIAVVNRDPKKSKYSDTLHRFCKKEHDWGWKKFMELSKARALLLFFALTLFYALTFFGAIYFDGPLCGPVLLSGASCPDLASQPQLGRSARRARAAEGRGLAQQAGFQERGVFGRGPGADREGEES